MKTKTKIIMLISTIIIALTYWMLLLSSNYNNNIKERNILLEKIKQAEERSNEKSKIEIIQNNLLNSYDIQKVYNQESAQIKKLREANIWYSRCLKAEGNLELSWKEYDLICISYNYNNISWANEKTYEDLKKFSSENLEKTLFELGLLEK